LSLEDLMRRRRRDDRLDPESGNAVVRRAAMYAELDGTSNPWRRLKCRRCGRYFYTKHDLVRHMKRGCII